MFDRSPFRASIEKMLVQVDELDMKIKAKENDSVSQERGKIDQLDSLLANQENIQVNIRHIGKISILASNTHFRFS